MSDPSAINIPIPTGLTSDILYGLKPSAPKSTNLMWKVVASGVQISMWKLVMLVALIGAEVNSIPENTRFEYFFVLFPPI